MHKEESLFNMPRTLTDFSNCVSLGKKELCALPSTNFHPQYNGNSHGEKEFFSPSNANGMHTAKSPSAFNAAHFPLLISLMAKLHML